MGSMTLYNFIGKVNMDCGVITVITACHQFVLVPKLS